VREVSIPRQSRGLYGVIPFDSIIDVDDKGDEFFSGPHIYAVPFSKEPGPFHYFAVTLETPRSASAGLITSVKGTNGARSSKIRVVAVA
jgi:hypothetical protein